MKGQMESKWRFEGSLKGQVESKWRLEGSLKGQVESKWRSKGNLKSQVESKWRLGVSFEGPRGDPEPQKTAQELPSSAQEASKKA